MSPGILGCSGQLGLAQSSQVAERWMGKGKLTCILQESDDGGREVVEKGGPTGIEGCSWQLDLAESLNLFLIGQ